MMSHSVVVVLLLSSLAAAQDLPGGEWSGPYVDKVVFRYFDAWENETQELLDGGIDAIGRELSFQETQALMYNEDIAIHETPSTSFYYFALNCRYFPTNVTAFRQAFAYSYDKNSVVDQYTDQIQVQDSCIPRGSVYHVGPPYEGEFYSERCEVANVLLDEAGFIDVDHDGYREAPDGSSVAVRIIEYNNDALFHSIALEAVAALERLGIASILDMNDFMLPLQDILQHPWNMILLQSDYTDTTLKWFNYQFHPDYNTSSNPYWNLEGFVNTQFLFSLFQLNLALNQFQVISHARELQRILINQCPIVPVCSPVKYYAHRTEEFANLYTDPFDSILSWWTPFKMSLKPESGGPYGGYFTYSLKGGLEGINPLKKPSSAIEQLIVNCLYDRLLITNLDGSDRKWLASKATIEYHSTNPDVPVGSTRITIRTRSNAIWTQRDYTVYNLTANDVVSTLLYHFNAQDTGYYSNVESMTSCLALNTTHLQVEFNSESFFHLHNIGCIPIIPALELEQIPYNEWSGFDITTTERFFSGPFYLEKLLLNDSVEISGNVYYEESLGWDMRAPIINAPEIYEVEYGSIGNFLEVSILDSNIEFVDLFLDDGSVQDDRKSIAGVSSSETRLIINMDGLAIGQYSLKIIAEDTYGFTSNSTVRIICKHYGVLDYFEDFIELLISPLGAFIVLPLAVSIACYSAYVVFIHGKQVSAEH